MLSNYGIMFRPIHFDAKPLQGISYGFADLMAPPILARQVLLYYLSLWEDAGNTSTRHVTTTSPPRRFHLAPLDFSLGEE